MLTIWWLTYLTREGLSPAGIIDLARPHTPWYCSMILVILQWITKYGSG